MRQCNNCHNTPCSCNRLNEEKLEFQDLFGSPFFCQVQKKTRRFTSPTSPLPQNELDELQACIEKVNDLLLSLASDSDNDNKRQLQLHFLAIKGEVVKAQILTLSHRHKLKMINNSNKSIYVIGRIATAGRDFIQINQVGSAVFILYNQLLSISRAENCEEENENELINIDSETRRELAFNFGRFVSKNPNLINLFFGIPLYLKLQQFVGKDVKVETYKESHHGMLIFADDETITIENQNEEININIDEICYLKVFNLK